MNTPAKPLASPTKRLDLGLKEVLNAAREVAHENNVPTHTYPRDVAQSATTTPAQSVTVEPPAFEPKAPKATVTTLPPAERKPKAAQRAPVKRYSVDLPLYVIADIREKAHKANQTKREYILNALNKGGIAIKDIDIREPADA